jgi:ribosomal protein L11 methyltransferase
MYYELRISINPEIEEIVSDICFSNFDCEGVVLAEETYKDLEMTSTTSGTLRVFLKDLNNNPVEILKTERELLKSRGFSDEELGSWEITLDEKENQDWSKKWKEKWTVTHVSDRITVVPSWLNYKPKKDEITIILDPGCAFGTGTHQTTQLCMKALEKYLHKGASVADIGTGSGILAILAKKLGAGIVYGCDNDETVIDVCKENAGVNGIGVNGVGVNGASPIVFELNTADKITEKYDFVCANILHNVLAEIMGDLKNIMKPNAKMVLSGILNEKQPVVLEAIEKHNLKIAETMAQDQWVAIVVTN